MGSALDGDLGQLSVVSIALLGLCSKALSLPIRVKLIAKSPQIHPESQRKFMVVNKFKCSIIKISISNMVHFLLMFVPEFDLKRFNIGR